MFGEILRARAESITCVVRQENSDKMEKDGIAGLERIVLRQQQQQQNHNEI